MSSFVIPNSLARYLRVYRGESQRQVATACGLCPSEVSRFERGTRAMDAQKVLRLAEYYGVSIDTLAFDNFLEALPSLPEHPQQNVAALKKQAQVDQKKIRVGRDGEAFVAGLEREKLKNTVYKYGVNESYADSLTSGFDVFSFTGNGQPLYIEVKSTCGGADEPFYLTAREKDFLEFCQASGQRYELHRVYHLRDSHKAERIILSAEDVLRCHFTPSVYAVTMRRGVR